MNWQFQKWNSLDARKYNFKLVLVSKHVFSATNIDFGQRWKWHAYELGVCRCSFGILRNALLRCQEQDKIWKFYSWYINKDVKITIEEVEKCLYFMVNNLLQPSVHFQFLLTQ